MAAGKLATTVTARGSGPAESGSAAPGAQVAEGGGAELRRLPGRGAATAALPAWPPPAGSHKRFPVP